MLRSLMCRAYKLHFLLTLLCAPIISSCGLVAPKIADPLDGDIPNGTLDRQLTPISGTSRLEAEVTRRIYCEIRRGVQTANRISEYHSDGYAKPKLVNSGLFPKGWGVQASLLFEVEEFTSLQPGFTLMSPLASLVTNQGSAHPIVNSQSSSVGFGATLSSTATRTDKVDPYWSVEELLPEIDDRNTCALEPQTKHFKNDIYKFSRPVGSPFLLEDGDLGIQDWIVGSMSNWYLFHGQQQKAPKHSDANPGPDTITLELKFVIVTSGNVTPTWRLARISADTVNPFFGIGRTRTHDLIVTIGPQNDPRTGETFLASLINAGRRR